jgi:tol-pal system protein YbgF
VKIGKWVVLPGLLVFFAGCATRDDAVILDRRTTALERNHYQLRDSTEDLKAGLSRRIDQVEKKMEAVVEPVQQNQANTTAQMETLKTRIQELQGRLETMDHSQKKEQARLSESLAKDLKDIQTRLQRLEQPPAPPAPSAEAAVKAEKTKEPVKEAKEEAREEKEPAKERAKTAPEDLYEEARAFSKKGAFDGAKKKYEEYLKAAPKGKYVEEARVGLAEALYEKKEYEEAILAYQKLIKSFPKSRHIPESLYKQALSFIQLKDTSSARLLLEKITKEFPRSSQAKLAQKKLKSL